MAHINDFHGGPFLLVRLAWELRFDDLLADLRDADYRSTLFEFVREDHP
jgi:hypothetical protein